MLSTVITCKNHEACDNCPLNRCCPLKLELRLQAIETESKKRRKWPTWLVVDILGFDSNRQLST